MNHKEGIEVSLHVRSRLIFQFFHKRILHGEAELCLSESLCLILIISYISFTPLVTSLTSMKVFLIYVTVRAWALGQTLSKKRARASTLGTAVIQRTLCSYPKCFLFHFDMSP